MTPANDNRDPLSPARGICIGLLFAAAFWLLVIAAVVLWRVSR